MSLTDVLNVTVSVSAASPSAAGFGEPLLFGYHTYYTDLVREYSTLGGMVSDGFKVTDPLYLMASAVASQSPAVPKWKIGRRQHALTQKLQITCTSTHSTDVYTIGVRMPGQSTFTIVGPGVTLPSGAVVPGFASTGVVGTDATTLAAALATAFTAIGSTATAAAVGAVVTITAGTAGVLLDVQPDHAHSTFADVTTDASSYTAADIAAVYAFDPAWYGLACDSNSLVEIAALAAWTEANAVGNAGSIFVWNNTDDVNVSAPSGDTTSAFYAVKHAAYTRSPGILSWTSLLSYSGAAWVGKLFPTVAGSEQWAYKTLAGVNYDTLTTSQASNIAAKNGSVYTQIAGVPVTQFGKTPDGEWIDIIRGRDAFVNTLQIQTFAMQLGVQKVPYTDAGMDMYRSTWGGVVQQFQASGFIAQSPAPTIILPQVAQLPATARAARTIPAGYAFINAQLAGAIVYANLSVTLTS
jgi:hypothetical protein